MGMVSKIYGSTDHLREVYSKHKQKKSQIPQPMMVFNPRLRRYELSCDFSQRHIPKRAGFSWDPLRKTWFTESDRKAVALIKYAGYATKAQLTYLLTN